MLKSPASPWYFGEKWVILIVVKQQFAAIKFFLLHLRLLFVELEVT